VRSRLLLIALSTLALFAGISIVRTAPVPRDGHVTARLAGLPPAILHSAR